MQLSIGELRSLINEAIGDRSKPHDKVHLICWVLSKAGRPMSRPDVMRKVDQVEGKDPEGFSPTSNNSYWAPAMVNRSSTTYDPETGTVTRSEPRMVPNDSNNAPVQSGVLIRGLVKVAGKQRNQLLYELTPEGQKFAVEADEFLKNDLSPEEYEMLSKF